MTKIKNVYFKNIKIRGILKAENDKINYEKKIFCHMTTLRLASK